MDIREETLSEERIEFNKFEVERDRQWRYQKEKERKVKGYERLRKRIEREYVKIYQFTDFQIDLLEDQITYFNKLGKKLLHKANPLTLHEQHYVVPDKDRFVPIIPDGVDFHAQVLKHFNG